MKTWNRGIAMSIAPIVFVATLLGFSLQQAVGWSLSYIGEPQQDYSQLENTWLTAGFPRMVAAMARLLDRTPDPLRPAVVAAAQRAAFRIQLLARPLPNLIEQHDNVVDLLRSQLNSFFLSARSAVIVGQQRGRTEQSVRGFSSIHSGTLVETSLSDGRWVSFENRWAPPPVNYSQMNVRLGDVAAWITISLILAFPLSLFAARSFAEPLREISSAAEQLGGKGEAIPLRAHGPREVIALIQVFNRLQERLRRFNEDRTRMFASMSHDLRTPLTRLRLRIELIDGLADQRKMLAELDATNDMIESMLAFAREESTHEPRSLLDLSALVEAICQDASDSGDPVTFSGPRGAIITGRPTALRRAVSNLVDNAIKYGKIALVTLRQESDHILITIEDEGPGIPWTEREKVFEPFYRMDKARDPNTGGVGLGLSVTRSIVWEHGGDIALTSRKGCGLCVRITLPAPVEQLAVSSPGPSTNNQHANLI